jgi:hypothetical protein
MKPTAPSRVSEKMVLRAVSERSRKIPQAAPGFSA